VILDESGREVGTAPGIWIASGDALWRIVRNQRGRVAHCADGTETRGSSLELSAIPAKGEASQPLLPPGADAATHVARLERSVGPYLFVSSTDDASACGGDAAAANAQVVDLVTGHADATVGDDALASVSALPPAVATRIAAMQAVGGVSHGAPSAIWRTKLGDAALQGALAAAFEPGLGHGGDLMYTDCLSSCGFRLSNLSCDLAKGRCSIGEAGMTDRADAKSSARVIAVLQFLDRTDGKARCNARRCKLSDVSCDWPREDASQASCKE
jgi:hypothetical protein